MARQGGDADLNQLMALFEGGGDAFGWIVAHGDQATIDDVWARTADAATLAEVYDRIDPRDIAWRTALARAYGAVLGEIFGTRSREVTELRIALAMRSVRKRQERLAAMTDRYGKHDGVRGPLELAVARLAWLGSLDDGLEWGSSIAELSTEAMKDVGKVYLDERWSFNPEFADYVRSVTPPPRLEDIVAWLESRPRKNPSASRRRKTPVSTSKARR